jgi:hypothetical protein
MGACTGDAEVLEGMLDALCLREFVFARLMALVDALGCIWGLSLSC